MNKDFFFLAKRGSQQTVVRITQARLQDRTCTQSISCALTFSKVLFFIYQRINIGEHGLSNLYGHVAGPIRQRSPRVARLCFGCGCFAKTETALLRLL